MSAPMSRAHVSLPDEPIDGYEIIAWGIDERELALTEYRWRYHARRSCLEVIGIAGVEWIDDWEVIFRGRCQGRIPGWRALSGFIDGQIEPLYLDVAKAREALRSLVLERERELRESLSRIAPELGGILAAGDQIPDITISRWACSPGTLWNPLRKAIAARRKAQGFDVDVELDAFDGEGWLLSRRREVPNVPGGV